MAGISVQRLEDRTQYKHKHKSIKRKGGSPPIDFSIVEMKVDLERAIREGNTEAVRTLYFKLNRIINGTG